MFASQEFAKLVQSPKLKFWMSQLEFPVRLGPPNSAESSGQERGKKLRRIDAVAAIWHRFEDISSCYSNHFVVVHIYVHTAYVLYILLKSVSYKASKLVQ